MQQVSLIRAASEQDADAIAELSAEFVAYLAALGDSAPRGITAAEYRHDGFGEHPAFAGLVAEHTGRVVAYLLYHPGYDIDRGGRVWHIIDLFVTERARRQGLGRALMARARAECHAHGGHALLWAIYPANVIARRFYERLGARTSADQLMSWPV
jgi:GNAT superfamily N-acetyltransferase